MKISSSDKKSILKDFKVIKTKKDLLLVINKALHILYPKNAKPFALKTLTYYANPKICKNRYSSFGIEKKSGSIRLIHAPQKTLKIILKCLNFIFQCIHKPHPFSMGFELNKSIIDNAEIHKGQRFVYNIDLVDFFHSFDRNRVKMGFMYKPFGLGKDREPLAFFLACLCTHPLYEGFSKKIVLPQGSPTSPILMNILCRTLDNRLKGLANRFGLNYSRYADDITFSSHHNVYKNADFLQELNRIIEDQKFQINQKKTRLQKNVFRQETTGLIINKKVNVRPYFIKQIRMWLFYWERYGYEKAKQNFEKDYPKSGKPNLKEIIPSLDNVLVGKLQFLKMVKGKTDSTYLKLAMRFEKLTRKKIIQKEEKKYNLNKHKPLDTTKFLNLFRSTDHPLKYLVHDYIGEQPFDYNRFIEDISEKFDEENKKYNIPSRFKGRLTAFIGINKKEWFFKNKRYNFSFKSKEVENWCDANPHKHPIRKFEEQINVFKESFRIEKNLKSLFQFALAESDLINKLEVEFTKGVETAKFFTDVDALLAGLKAIFNSIGQRRKYGKKVQVDFYTIRNPKGRFRTIRIAHIGSKCNEILDEEIFGGDLKDAKKSFYQLCDWSIISENESKEHNKLNILYNPINDISPYEKIEDEITGFTHLLTFYS